LGACISQRVQVLAGHACACRRTPPTVDVTPPSTQLTGSQSSGSTTSFTPAGSFLAAAAALAAAGSAVPAVTASWLAWYADSTPHSACDTRTHGQASGDCCVAPGAGQADGRMMTAKNRSRTSAQLLQRSASCIALPACAVLRYAATARVASSCVDLSCARPSSSNSLRGTPRPASSAWLCGVARPGGSDSRWLIAAIWAATSVLRRPAAAADGVTPGCCCASLTAALLRGGGMLRRAVVCLCVGGRKRVVVAHISCRIGDAWSNTPSQTLVRWEQTRACQIRASHMQ
jgi:hypothetical protein